MFSLVDSVNLLISEVELANKKITEMQGMGLHPSYYNNEAHKTMIFAEAAKMVAITGPEDCSVPLGRMDKMSYQRSKEPMGFTDVTNGLTYYAGLIRIMTPSSEEMSANDALRYKMMIDAASKIMLHQLEKDW